MLNIYTDDTGNTGPALLDSTQPVAVTAMVLLAPDEEERVLPEVSRLKSMLQQPPAELKFKNLVKRDSGRALIDSVMRTIRDMGVRVLFSVTEKRYLAASLFVETFLDPLCTPGVPDSFKTHEMRTMAANLVYRVSAGDSLDLFMRAFGAHDPAAITATGRRFILLLQLHPADEAPALAEVLNSVIDKPYIHDGGEGIPRLLGRPTALTYTHAHLLHAVDECLHQAGQTGRLLADNDLQFGELLNASFEVARDPSIYPHPYAIRDLPVTRITERLAVDSKDYLGVQLADLCAGVMAAAANAGFSDSPPAVPPIGWVDLQSATLALRTPAIYWQASEQMIRALQPSFGKLLPLLEDGSFRW